MKQKKAFLRAYLLLLCAASFSLYSVGDVSPPYNASSSALDAVVSQLVATAGEKIAAHSSAADYVSLILSNARNNIAELQKLVDANDLEAGRMLSAASGVCIELSRAFGLVGGTREGVEALQSAIDTLAAADAVQAGTTSNIPQSHTVVLQLYRDLIAALVNIEAYAASGANYTYADANADKINQEVVRIIARVSLVFADAAASKARALTILSNVQNNLRRLQLAENEGAVVAADALRDMAIAVGDVGARLSTGRDASAIMSAMRQALEVLAKSEVVLADTLGVSAACRQIYVDLICVASMLQSPAVASFFSKGVVASISVGSILAALVTAGLAFYAVR